MRLNYRGNYSVDWSALSRAIRADAGWRCVRCLHPFDPATGRPLTCDERCDPGRGRTKHGLRETVEAYPSLPHVIGGVTHWTTPPTGPHAPRIPGLNYGVHHLDGDKDNNRWWNLLPLCNSCHLYIQSTVIPERPWLFEHSPWFVPYACGFYAYWYGRPVALDITRAEADATPTAWLKLGQPWLYPDDRPTGRPPALVIVPP